MTITKEDFTTFIQSRRSLRRYEDRRVPRAILQTLLECANWAPSAHNRQPWRFAVIETPATQEKLANAMGARLRADLSADNAPQDIIEKDVSRSYSRITGAAALICLCLSMEDMDDYPDKTRSHNEYLMAVQSTAMAGQNLLLAAHQQGLGACWMCAPLFCADVVQDALDLPHHWQPQGLITLGYPAQTRERTREAVENWTVWR